MLVDNEVNRNVDNIVKKVAYLEQFFELIYDVHSIKRCHQGIDVIDLIKSFNINFKNCDWLIFEGIIKTHDQICLRYHGITRLVVAMFRKYCYVCDLKQKQQSQPRLKPIISNSLFERVQLDLVDMRCSPDGEYKWIAHMVDHNTQFHVLWPQKDKTGDTHFIFHTQQLTN